MSDIQFLLALGVSVEEVAERAGRAPEAIRYEIARNREQDTTA